MNADVAHMIAMAALVMSALLLLAVIYSVVSSWAFLELLDYLVRKFRL
jgi:hypothetical protein